MTDAEQSIINNYGVVFPGQGSQSVGMLSDWNAQEKIVSEVLDQACDALGYDLRTLIKDGPSEELNQTSITQPAMLTAGVVAWRIWQAYCESTDLAPPDILAGHSLGEYTALVAAGALDFSDALRLVEYRGQCMQEAVSEGEGAMAAVLGLEDAKVIEACDLAAAEGIVEAVNFNAPGQVVIAGEAAAVETAIKLLKEAGARRAIPLPVSVPSHCQLMIPAAKKLENYLESVSFKTPSIPVIHNVDVKTHNDVASIRRILVEQLHKPVRWVECMQAVGSSNVNVVIECGPGKVLSGLQRRIDRDVKIYPLYSDDTMQTLAEAISASSVA